MLKIDLETWPRRDHFRLFNSMNFPHIGICLQIDITNLWINRAKFGFSPTVTLVYIINKAANRIPELRQRIRSNEVVEHEIINSTIAILGDDGTFGVSLIPFDTDYSAFSREAEKRINITKKNPSMDDFHIGQDGEIKRDDILAITVLPWLSFTSFDLTRTPQFDSVPLLAWGKVSEDGDKFLLPFFINFHHALVDGLHIALFIQNIEEEIQEFSSRFS